MKPLLALLILAAALFVGACNTNPGGSAVPTLNPVPSTVTSPGVSQTRLPVSRAHDQVTGIRTRRPVELPVRPARHLRPERSAA